jgi:hypothetical protein
MTASALLHHTGAVELSAAAEVEVPLEERIVWVAVVPHKPVELLQTLLAVGLSITCTRTKVFYRRTVAARRAA